MMNHVYNHIIFIYIYIGTKWEEYGAGAIRRPFSSSSCKRKRSVSERWRNGNLAQFATSQFVDHVMKAEVSVHSSVARLLRLSEMS
jgi:hypothetical protein